MHSFIFSIFKNAPHGASSRSLPLLLAALAAIAAPSNSSACSVCGCSLSSDWAAQGYNTAPQSLTASVRYEYFNQDDLRSSTGNISKTPSTTDEIQQQTLNRNAWLGLDYVFNPSWALSVQLPYYDRAHSTIQAADTDASYSHANGLGDVKVLARYQIFNHSESLSFQAGLKLPTGRFNQNFDSGPAAGTLLDRGLQLGTGTTDFLANLGYFTRPLTNLGVFAQATFQQPLAAREDFLPSTTFGINTGARYLNTSRFTPQLQINTRWDSREHGGQADTPNSGDFMVYLSPGVTVDLGHGLEAYGFWQVPVYQNVNGLQLTPRWLITVGVSYKL